MQRGKQSNETAGEFQMWSTEGGSRQHTTCALHTGRNEELSSQNMFLNLNLMSGRKRNNIKYNTYKYNSKIVKVMWLESMFLMKK